MQTLTTFNNSTHMRRKEKSKHLLISGHLWMVFARVRQKHCSRCSVRHCIWPQMQPAGLQSACSADGNLKYWPTPSLMRQTSQYKAAVLDSAVVLTFWRAVFGGPTVNICGAPRVIFFWDRSSATLSQPTIDTQYILVAPAQGLLPFPFSLVTNVCSL